MKAYIVCLRTVYPDWSDPADVYMEEPLFVYTNLQAAITKAEELYRRYPTNDHCILEVINNEVMDDPVYLVKPLTKPEGL